MKSTVYNNILSDDFCDPRFSKDGMTAQDLERLQTISCVKLSVDDFKDQTNEFLLRSIIMEQIIIQLIKDWTAFSYLVKVSNGAPRGRVRSYKGFFKSKVHIASGEYLDSEIDDNGSSFFIGFAKISQSNLTACVEESREVTKSFILLSESGLDELHDVITSNIDFIVSKKTMEFNCRPIPLLLHSSGAYLRRTTYGNGDSMNLDIFACQPYFHRYAVARDNPLGLNN